MQRLLFFTYLFAIPWLSFGAQVEELILFHKSGEALVLNSEIASIEDFFESFEDKKIEKLNIHCFTLDFVNDKQNAERSDKRLNFMYAEILKHMKDERNVELINMNRESVTPKNARSYTRFVVYLLDNNVMASEHGTEKDLFPEEFIQLNEKTYIPKIYNKDSSFEIPDIQFHGNSSVFLEDSEDILIDLKKFLLLNPTVRIKIIGHVNGRLSKSYLEEAAKSNPERKVYRNSEHLSRARAQTIKRYLTEEGISEKRIEIEGKGAGDMKFKSPKNKKQEAANRRIEVVIL